MFKTVFTVDCILEATILIACAAAWAAAGFPRLTDVVVLPGLGFALFGLYVGIIVTRD